VIVKEQTQNRNSKRQAVLFQGLTLIQATYFRKISLLLTFIIPPLLSAPVTSLSVYHKIYALFHNFHYIVGDGLIELRCLRCRI